MNNKTENAFALGIKKTAELGGKEHPLVGMVMTKNDQLFSITNILLDDAFKPLGGRGTWDHVVVFTDEAGELRYGPIEQFATPEQIEQTLFENGYAWVINAVSSEQPA